MAIRKQLILTTRISAGAYFALTLAILIAACRPTPTQTVYIAPFSGTRYHATRDCNGLSNGRNITPVPLAQAQAEGKTPCNLA